MTPRPKTPPIEPTEPPHADPEAIAELLAVARDQSASRMGVSGHSISDTPVFVSRLLSALVAAAYFSLAYSRGVPLIRVVQFLVLPLAVVWFPRALSQATGRLGLAEAIRRPSSPRWALGWGWVLLLMPLWLGGILRLWRLALGAA